MVKVGVKVVFNKEKVSKLIIVCYDFIVIVFFYLIYYGIFYCYV